MKTNTIIKQAFTAFIVLSVNLISSGKLYAQAPPEIPDQIKKLYEYEGTWKGDAVMTAGSEVSKGTSIHQWSKISAGWGMLILEEVDIPAMGYKYLGHNIFGYDIGEKQFHLYTVDNFADVHDHKGTMKDDKTMYLIHNGVQPDGKSYREEITMNMTSSKEYKIHVNGIVDGTLSYTFEMNMKKEQ